MLPLESRIAPDLKRMGFLKTARTWRRTSPSVVQVLNLQKSPWGPAPLYVNLGVYFRRFGPDMSPSENQCHVRARLERVASPTRWNAICALAADQAPSEEAVAALLEDGISWLDSFASEGGLQRFLASSMAKSVFVDRLVREAGESRGASGT